MPRKTVSPLDPCPRGQREKVKWMNARKKEAEKAYAAALATGNEREAEIFKNAAVELIEHNNPGFFQSISEMNKIPVPIDEFMDSPEFLACDTNDPLMEFWPNLRPIIRQMNPDVCLGETPLHTVYMAGATGYGKSFGALATNLYQVYLFTCFNNPHKLFRLSKETTPIVFMFMSASGTLAKRTLYQPFRNAFTNMRYAKRHLQWNRFKESQLELEQGIIVAPALADLKSILGQAIPGGIVDEINFMSVVENSTQVAGPTGQGGKYDQAEIIVSNLLRRRRRSFATSGVSLGTTCLPSSVRYKGDFLDRKIEEVTETHEGDTVDYDEGRMSRYGNTLITRYKQYDIAPLKDKRDVAGETFPVLIGTDDYPTRILTESDAPGVTYPENGRVEHPPISYKTFFLSDPEGACRDIVGVASNAITPFFSQRHLVLKAMADWEEAGEQSFLVKDNVNLAEDGMPQIGEEWLPADREALRFVHVDLSSSVDSTGIAMVRYDGHTPVPNPNNPELFDLMPKFTVEMALSIKPDTIHQIDPAEVRQWIMQLITVHGFNIQRVSYDGFQSKESLRQFRKAGVASKLISVDKTSDPYKTFRSAVYEGRVLLPDNDILRQEMISLEYRADKDKVDHPPKGRKDISDAVCGAIFSANNSRAVRDSNAVVNSGGRPIARESGVQVRDIGRRQDMQRR